VTNADLLKDSICADCHATKAVRNGQVKVISGVSCEKCHGAAGGEQGWLNRHQSYHASMPIPRADETPEHRAARIKACDEAGMIRSSNLYSLSKACFNCHIVGNEKLIAAGHKSASAFDFVSWSSGEVRHNFLVNKSNNADAPSLWMERTGGNAENRRRMKFVVGTLVQLETALRLRAQATNPAVIPQLSGIIAAANGKLTQMNAFAPAPELQTVTTLITPMFGTLFAPLPNDKETYTKAADKVSEQAKTVRPKSRWLKTCRTGYDDQSVTATLFSTIQREVSEELKRLIFSHIIIKLSHYVRAIDFTTASLG